jgi:hypothetical protein
MKLKKSREIPTAEPLFFSATSEADDRSCDLPLRMQSRCTAERNHASQGEEAMVNEDDVSAV